MQTPTYQREQEILRLLDQVGRVSVPELSELFGATPVTVRKDLDRLEARKLLRRVRGGAVPAVAPDEGAFELRLTYRREIKQAIARRAAQLIEDEETIALDCSTTSYYLAEQLLTRRGLVVVTNGLRAAELLAGTATVVLAGGTLRRASWSLVGGHSTLLSRGGDVAHGFFGVRALSPEHGLLELSLEEAQAKRSLAGLCRNTWALFDSSKVGRFALHAFADPGRVTGLITDEGFGDDVAQQWRGLGVQVERVPAPAARSPQ